MLVAEVSGLRYFFLLRLLRLVIVLRPPPDWIASAVQSDSVRRPIGFRPPSDDLSIKIVAEVSGLRSTKSDTNKYS